MNILADATLPDLKKYFSSPYKLSVYSSVDELYQRLPKQDILLCRANLKINADLIANTHLKAIASASSGIDHIDENISCPIFDAKGCNAIAVADYILTVIAALKRHYGISFSPQETSAGIIGVGKVGTEVSQRLQKLGFKIKYFDPYQKNIPQCSLTEITTCRLIFIHANLHHHLPYPSAKMLDKKWLSQLTPGTVLINAARGGIVVEADLLTQPKLIYCTDVYENEPKISKKTMAYAKLCTPHIAGHSIESKQRAVQYVAEKLSTYFKINLSATLAQQPLITHPFKTKNWQDAVLEIYDPFADTQSLKTAKNLKDTFLTLRKAHQFRHDFNQYSQLNFK